MYRFIVIVEYWNLWKYNTELITLVCMQECGRIVESGQQCWTGIIRIGDDLLFGYRRFHFAVSRQFTDAGKRCMMAKNVYYYRKAVLKHMSSTFDEFLASRSQFNWTAIMTSICMPLHIANLRPLDCFLRCIVLCFLRVKIMNTVAICHRCVC